MIKKGNNKKLISLKRQLSVLFAVLYTSVLLALIFFFLISVINYQKQINSARLSNIELCAKTLETDILQTKNTILNVYMDNASFGKLSSKMNSLERFNTTYNLLDILQMDMARNKGIYALFIYYNNLKDVIYSVRETLKLSDKNEIMKYNQILVTSGLKKGYGSQIIIASEKLYYSCYAFRDQTAILGLICLEDIIADLRRYDTENVEVALKIGDSVTFPEDQNSTVNKETIQKIREGKTIIGKRIYYTVNLHECDLTLVYSIPNTIWSYIKVQHILILVVLIISTYPAWRLYQLMKRQILQPLSDMTKTMRKIQNEDWEASFQLNTNLEEIVNANKALLRMTREIKNLKIQAYEEKSQRQSAQLQYLQLQLNPHFFINSLKLIQAKLQLGYTESIEDFLIQLSVHFRYLMKNGTELVTVKEELQFTKNYIELAQELYPGKVTETISVDEDIKQKMIPMLAIQTFVENSVKYARKDMEQNLNIHIKVQNLRVDQERYLNIIVRDNGVGFPEEYLKGLNSTSGDTLVDGIGISNLKRRMLLFYNESCNWYFYNQDGAVSELLLPRIKKIEGSE